MRSLTDFFQFWRTMVSRDHEVVDAVILPHHRGPSPELREALGRFPGVHYWDDTDGTKRLILVRPLAPPPRERWWLHATLFAITFLTVWIGGALLAGAEPFEALRPGIRGLSAALSPIVALRPGLEFAMGLMAILLAHETGHYIVARRYGLNVSPPYFLPAPPIWPFLHIGTFGAFIRLRSPVVDRRQLLDVGVAGPWVGFVVACVVLVAGLLLSQPTQLGQGEASQLIMLGSRPLYLGDSLVMAAARELFAPEGGAILLHPMAFAGWLGLLVTMLNLLPLGQLDGGHVLYGLIGRRQAWVAWVTWFGILALGTQFIGWFIWAAFTLLLGRGRLHHPSVLDHVRAIPSNRRPLGWATVLLFVVTFTPVPWY